MKERVEKSQFAPLSPLKYLMKALQKQHHKADTLAHYIHYHKIHKFRFLLKSHYYFDSH